MKNDESITILIFSKNYARTIFKRELEFNLAMKTRMVSRKNDQGSGVEIIN